MRRLSPTTLPHVPWNAQNISNDKLTWDVIIHLTFVLSALGMASVDRMNPGNGVKPH